MGGVCRIWEAHHVPYKLVVLGAAPASELRPSGSGDTPSSSQSVLTAGALLSLLLAAGVLLYCGLCWDEARAHALRPPSHSTLLWSQDRGNARAKPLPHSRHASPLSPL